MLWTKTPAYWRRTRLKFAVSLTTGQSPPSETYNTLNLGVPFLQGNADFGDRSPRPTVHCEWPQKVANADDLLFSVRAPIGALNLADQTYGIGRGLCAIRPDPKGLKTEFAWYLLSATTGEIEAAGTGSTYDAVSASDVGSLEIRLPPVDEQMIIADFLDRETAKIDALIQKKKLLTELLATEAGNTVDSAIGECAQSAERLTLRRVVRRFVDYRGLTRSKTVSGVPLVTARNIKNGRIAFEESEEFIAEEDYGRWMVRGIPDRGDVLLTTEAPLGEVALVEDPKIALAQRIILLKVDPGRILSKFLWCYFRSNLGRMELETRATGSTAIGIKASHLRAVPIIVPSLQRQLEIVGAYEAKLNSSARLISEIEGAIDRPGEYRAALLTAAVTGKIDVRDPA